jgi:acetylornithine deacetylase
MTAAGADALIRKLVAINSANPATCPGGAGEAELAEFCRGWLNDRGLKAHLCRPCAGSARPALIAMCAGRGGGRRVALCGHLDTHSWFPPSGEPENGCVRGAGACDMKGGIAAIMLAMTYVRRTRHGGDVFAIMVPDEEHASVGMRALARDILVDAAIVAEDTGLGIGVSQTGRIRVTICHGSAEAAADVIVELTSMLQLGTLHYAKPTFARTLHPSPMTVLEWPVQSGDDAHALAARLRTDLAPILHNAAHWDVRESFFTAAGEPIVAVLAQLARRAGTPPRLVRLTRWTEAGILAARSIPSVVFGPGGGGAHTRDEWVDVDQVEKAAHILGAAALEFSA